MLTPNQIVRLIDSHDHRRLIDRILVNGRCHSRIAQQELQRAEALMPSAIGLGLQRICELVYWPVPDGGDLAHRLLRLQRRDGHFGPPHSVSDRRELLVATAVAIRGLLDWNANFSHRNEERALLERSIQRGLNALHLAWSENSTSGDCDADASWAIVLWQLGDIEIAGRILPVHSIRAHLMHAAPEMLADDLTRLALTMAA